MYAIRSNCFKILLVLFFVALSSSPSLAEVDLDAVSSECLSCHEEFASPSAAVHIAQGHLSPKPYAEMVAANKKLRLANELPADILLYKGRITCVSCHPDEPHDGVPLVISNENSALCTACHLI